MQHTIPALLGDITAFTIATPDLEVSLAFYQQLGFSEIMRADWPFPWIQVSDGVVLIMLRKDPAPYIALTYYVQNIDKVATTLDSRGIEFAQRARPNDALKRCLLQSPDGLNISLIGMTQGFSQPPGPGMLSMPQQDMYDPAKYVNKTCGLFGELTHPVTDLEASLIFWEKLGFHIVSKYGAPYPWAIITDGLSVVGLHQSTHFSYPAITYFAADMPQKINRLKATGLANITDQGPGNVMLTTPEQQHIFLFSLGMPPATSEVPALPPQHVIETDRLLLKEITPEYTTAVFNSCSDEQIIQLLGIAAVDLEKEKDNFRKGLTTWRLSFKNFLISEKETSRLIGRCGFHTWYLLHARAEAGYAIFSDADKNKGYMTEAMKALLAFGFRDMQLNRIEAFIGTQNEPSLKMIRNLSFTEEGTLRSHYYKNGSIEDSVCFSLLKDEYTLMAQ